MNEALAIVAALLALSGFAGAHAAYAQSPAAPPPPSSTQSVPERVTFPSADRTTTLVGEMQPS
jgi:hypothetical protein